MRRMRWLMRRVPQLAVAIVVVMAAGPEAVRAKIHGALVATWRTMGAVLVDQDLAAMGRKLDTARDEVRHVEAERDALELRLRNLEARRRAAGPRAEQARAVLTRMTALLNRLPEGDERTDLSREADRYLRQCLAADFEVSQLDGATVAVAREVARANRLIEATQARLLAAETELAVLSAADETRRFRQALQPLGNTSPDSEPRAGRVAEILEAIGPAPPPT